MTEKVSDQPESHDDKEKVVEYSVPSWQVSSRFSQAGATLFDSSQDIIFCFSPGLECFRKDGLQGGDIILYGDRVWEA